MPWGISEVPLPPGPPIGAPALSVTAGPGGAVVALDITTMVGLWWVSKSKTRAGAPKPQIWGMGSSPSFMNWRDTSRGDGLDPAFPRPLQPLLSRS